MSEARKQAHFDDITKALLRGEEVPRDLIEWKRGYFAGMEFLLRRPQAKANELAKALAKREEVTLNA